MSAYNVNMFEAIKASLNKANNNGGNSTFKDVLRFEKNNTYLVRLLPNIHNIEETFLHYFQFGWESKATGQYVSAVSPVTIKERCPINELRMKLYRSGNKADEEFARTIRRSEQWMVNCYVVNNPTNPELEGEVKILRYGKQLDKIIKDAVEGDDADEYGPAVFDLTENGCNLRIKVETNEGGYPTYVSSRFLKPSTIPGITKSKIDDVYNKAFDLSDLLQIKPYEELEEMINIHLLNKPTETLGTPKEFVKQVDEEDFDEEIPGLEEKPKKTKKKVEEKTEKEDDFDIDDDIDELLAGID